MIVLQLIIFQFLLFLYSTIMWGFLRIREYFLDGNRYYIGHILKEPQISMRPAHFKHHRTEADILALHTCTVSRCSIKPIFHHGFVYNQLD